MPGAALAVLLLSGASRADDPTECWPELNRYERLGPETRLCYCRVRVGYDRVSNTEGRTNTTPEDRGIVALHGRA